MFLAGANAGLIPLASAWRDAAQLAEERRLLFVGLTRARDTVEISYLTQPSRPDVLPEPSSFLADVPPDAIRWLTPDQVAERTRDPKPAAAASSKWTVGQRVRHRRYGEGEVVAANQTQVTVAFGPRGQKSFSPIACPLQPIPS